MFKKFVSLLLALVMAALMIGAASATDTLENALSNVHMLEMDVVTSDADEPTMSADVDLGLLLEPEGTILTQHSEIRIVPVSELEISPEGQSVLADISSERYAVVETITDEAILAEIVETEGIDETASGQLTSREVISILPTELANDIMQSQSNTEPPPGPAPITIENVTLMGHMYYFSDEYTPYRADGPGTFQISVSSTGTSSWNYSGTLTIKSMVEAKVGYTVSQSRTVSATYTATVADGKYALIKVYNYYSMHSFDLYRGNLIGTYHTWYPNDGLRVIADHYNK
jgi:hypothetical protein